MGRANTAADAVADGPLTGRMSINGGLDAKEDSRVAALVTLLRLHWFIRLRWVFLLAAVVALAVERLVLPQNQRPFGLAVVLAALCVANLGWLLVSHVLFGRFRDDASVQSGLSLASRAPAGSLLGRVEILANAQVAVDLLLLTCILRFTGGVENPAAIFYLFHMAITALLLKRWQAVLQGVWAVVLYGGLAGSEWQGWLAPHYGFLPCHDFGLYAQPAFVGASVVVVACGIFGTLYFTSHIVRRLEEREHQLRRANADLRRSQITIQDLQLRRSRFMQTAAHQLKSPLAVIQTLADLIRNNIVPPDGVADTCDKIARRCNEGIAQVSELLTLARVQEADPARHTQAEANVCEVLSELCERFRPLAEKKNVTLDCHLPETGALRVRVEPQDLSDCVGNLIENAIRYTPGPGRVTVTAAVESTPGRPAEVSINVTDTGMGIHRELLTPPDGVPGHEPVFDAFRRGNNALAAGIPGTGLGLSIVREIVEQAGGRIRVTSRPDEGSSFTVTFPSHEEARQELQVRDTRASEVVIEPGGSTNGRLQAGSGS
jgi:signal transduction histidine kinase